MTYGSGSAQPKVANVQTVVAPTGGLNDVDPLAAMEENFCIQCMNWLPGNTSMNARQGYREWATGLTGTVKTLMPYYAMDGTFKLFATTDSGIYDVSTPTAVPPVVVAAGNGRYNHVMFSTVAQQYLVAVNGGSDPSLLYNGTAWSEFTEVPTTPVNPGEIKGVNPDSFSHVTSFKRRLWFVQEGTQTAWYLPIDAVAGEAKPFYLGSIFRRGGKLLYMIDWSVDASDGLANKLIFVSDVGELAIYDGDNPDLTESWELQSTFFLSAPIGDKSFCDFGGDVLLSTNFGLIPLTKALIGRIEETPMEAALTRNINRTINRLVNSRKYPRNWEVHNFSMLQAIVIFIPPFGDLPPIQFVMNSLTGAWTRADVPATCAVNAVGRFFFGTPDGRVCLYGEENYLDDVKLDGTGGNPVLCSLFTAYNYMGDPTTIKHWKLVRPIFQTDQPPSYRLTLNMDFDFSSLPGNPAPPGPELDNPLWDVAIWDNAFWSSALTVFRPWVGVAGIGFCCALLLKLASTDATALVAVEYVYERGGAI